MHTSRHSAGIHVPGRVGEKDGRRRDLSCSTSVRQSDRERTVALVAQLLLRPQWLGEMQHDGLREKFSLAPYTDAAAAKIRASNELSELGI